MNKQALSKRTQITQCLVKGMSPCATSRITDTSINTVTKLLVDVCKACARFRDETVVGISAQCIQADEIWSFCYVKENNVEKAEAAPTKSGDVWTWTGIDADTRLIVSWYVGNSDADSAFDFMMDVEIRIANRNELTTDGSKPYLKAADKVYDGCIDLPAACEDLRRLWWGRKRTSV